MLRRNEFSNAIEFIVGIVFSIGVIFMCCFGIVSVFRTMSSYGINDFEQLSTKNADTIVATIIDDSVADDSMISDIMDEIGNVVNDFDKKATYTFAEATEDAEAIFNSMTSGDNNELKAQIQNVEESITGLFVDSKVDEVSD